MEDAPGPDESPPLLETDLPKAARTAIRQLFEQGRIDENTATVGLLALDLGLRRSGDQGAES